MASTVGRPVLSLRASSSGQRPSGAHLAGSMMTRVGGTKARAGKLGLRARGRPCRLVTTANVMWRLEVNQEWCEIAAETCKQVYPLDLSSMIDDQRPGPNKTWSIKVGGPRDGGKVCPEDDLDLVIDIQAGWLSESPVTGLHAEFEEDGDGDLYVSDAKSKTGTYVNGERVSGKTKLNPGDTVSFGKDGIVFTATRDVKAHA